MEELKRVPGTDVLLAGTDYKPGPRELTDEGVEKIGKWLNEKTPPLCPMCHDDKHGYAIYRKLGYIPQIGGSAVVLVIAMECTHCHTVQFFNFDSLRRKDGNDG